MMVHHRVRWACVLPLLGIAISGCASTHNIDGDLNFANYSGIPRELDKATLPQYRVEPPDVLLIEVVNNIRTEAIPLRVGETVNIRLGNPAPLQLTDENSTEAPTVSSQMLSQFELEREVRNKFIDGEFTIQPDGSVHLGPVYGNVRLEGLTVSDARAAIENRLRTYKTDTTGRPVGLQNPLITVSLPELAGKQVIAGEHLVRPDGAVSLGIYGSVFVTGLTLDEIRSVLEEHLSQYIHHPEVAVDVLAYNSKSIYVITDGGGFGERVVKLPVTGNETVLDAIAEIQGLSEVSSKKIWIARPAPAGTDVAQILDVHWKAITQEGITTTNYQLFPGDRVYIEADKMIHTDNFIAKTLAPFERIFGIIALGSGVHSQLRFIHTNNNQF